MSTIAFVVLCCVVLCCVVLCCVVLCCVVLCCVVLCCVVLFPGHVHYQSAHASVYDDLLAGFKVVDLCDPPTDMGYTFSNVLHLAPLLSTALRICAAFYFV